MGFDSAGLLVALVVPSAKLFVDTPLQETETGDKQSRGGNTLTMLSFMLYLQCSSGKVA